MKTLFAIVAGSMATYGLLAQSPRPPVSSTGANRPPVQVSPPLSEEEAKLLREIHQLASDLAEHADAKDAESSKSLRVVVESHFDFLSRHSDERIEEMKRHLAKIVESAEQRKAARSELVEAEMKRLINDARSLKYYPDTLSILKTTGAARPPSSQGK